MEEWALRKCKYCNTEHDAICSLIKAIEYHDNGKEKRIEFFSQKDYMSIVPNYNIWPDRNKCPVPFEGPVC